MLTAGRIAAIIERGLLRQQCAMNATETAGLGWQDSRPSGRPFLKMHGLRNHFVIVDARQEPYRPDSHDIVRICDPQIGIGADQLVVIEPSSADDVDAFMRLYNVDGREVEACGNATRCVAWLLMEESGRHTARIETLAGVLQCRRTGDRRVACDMGRISTAWRDVPLSRRQDTLHLDLEAGPLRDPVALNVGNPHVVFFVDDIDAIDLPSLAPTIQRDPMFPDQVNVGLVQLARPNSLRLVVYERGAGLTAACGSGACAAAYAARARGLTTSDTITVTMPAGHVDIEITDDEHAVMSGPVGFCFTGYL